MVINSFVVKGFIAMLVLASLFGCEKPAAPQAASDVAAVSPDPATESLLSGIRWQLTELMGAPVAADSGIFIHFTADGRVLGYNGCNNFMGSYQQQGLSLSMSQLASTMKACFDAPHEVEFMQVLQMADNISLAAEVLSVNKARMAPLARFVAVTPND